MTTRVAVQDDGISLKEHVERLMLGHEEHQRDQFKHITDMFESHEKIHAAHEVSHERDHTQTKQALDAAAGANKDALDAAALALKERLLEMNDFRKQIEAERREYATKDDLVAAVKEVKQAIAGLESKLDTTEGGLRESTKAQVAIVAATAETNSKRLDVLERAAANFTGRLAALGGLFVLVPIAISIVLWLLSR